MGKWFWSKSEENEELDALRKAYDRGYAAGLSARHAAPRAGDDLVHVAPYRHQIELTVEMSGPSF